MRILISLILASMYAGTSLPAIAETASVEPAKAGTSAPPAGSPDRPAGTPPAQEKAKEQATSGTDQPLCIQQK